MSFAVSALHFIEITCQHMQDCAIFFCWISCWCGLSLFYVVEWLTKNMHGESIAVKRKSGFNHLEWKKNNRSYNLMDSFHQVFISLCVCVSVCIASAIPSDRWLRSVVTGLVLTSAAVSSDMIMLAGMKSLHNLTLLTPESCSSISDLQVPSPALCTDNDGICALFSLNKYALGFPRLCSAAKNTQQAADILLIHFCVYVSVSFKSYGIIWIYG